MNSKYKKHIYWPARGYPGAMDMWTPFSSSNKPTSTSSPPSALLRDRRIIDLKTYHGWDTLFCLIYFGQFELVSCQKENFSIISFITKEYLLYLIQQLSLRGILLKVALRSGERGVLKQKRIFLQNSAFYTYRISPKMYGFVLKKF